ncbi:FecCD family ABC transporter permease [Streptococcus catagoni]|uniref:FecCD family ABC transporter permease n=1 Tax=Streptococcus catagoni TaxID=2654874 RepID=UPI00140E580F|nr:iron ABC transporter permease [Streptococcus catagoni]
MTLKRRVFLLPILLLIVVCAFIISLSIGDSSFSIQQIFNLLLGKTSPDMILIITKIRLPRILASLFGGASLALAGRLLQTLTKNPLADSGILGINAGAGLVIAIMVSFANLENPDTIHYLPFLAMLGSFTSTFLVYHLSLGRNRQINPFTLIIIGVGFSTMLSSFMIALVGNINRYKVDYIVNWLSGRISGDDWTSLEILTPLMLILWVIVFSKAYQLNILSLSEESAISLGLNVKRERLLCLVLATSLAALSVSLVGNITFIGLISGHLGQRLLGDDHRLNLPASLLIGMILLLVSDTICRVFLVGANISTGIIISLIGAPYFLYLMFRSH